MGLGREISKGAVMSTSVWLYLVVLIVTAPHMSAPVALGISTGCGVLATFFLIIECMSSGGKGDKP